MTKFSGRYSDAAAPLALNVESKRSKISATRKCSFNHVGSFIMLLIGDPSLSRRLNSFIVASFFQWPYERQCHPLAFLCLKICVILVLAECASFSQIFNHRYLL